MAKHSSFLSSPMMSIEKGKSNAASKVMCKIVWTIEADLEAGQFLYITGDPTVLGCWEPGIAILMSPTEHTNLWKAEVKINGGVNFKYNYFIKTERWPSYDITWSPGPELSISVPLPVKQSGKIIVRDSWMRTDTTMSPIRSWGSWVEEAYLPIQLLFSAPARESESPKKLAYTIKSHAKTLQPPGFGLTVRTVAAGHSLEELQKDLEGLVSTWKNITEHAKSAALAADEGVEGAIPVILQRGNGSLSVVQDYFIETVEKMVVDSPRTYHEVSNYLQEIAPDLCDRVEVPLANGGSLVIEQTEALVSIDVNGGLGMFGHGNSQEKAILEVNLAAAKEIAREL
ncbi:hypothetical protein ACFX1X_024625 [Malus domestica]